MPSVALALDIIWPQLSHGARIVVIEGPRVLRVILRGDALRGEHARAPGDMLGFAFWTARGVKPRWLTERFLPERHSSVRTSEF